MELTAYTRLALFSAIFRELQVGIGRRNRGERGVWIHLHSTLRRPRGRDFERAGIEA
jgi:hypothetical protein